MGLALTAVGEHRGEQARTRDQALAGAHKLVEETAAIARGAPVTKHSLHDDGGVLVHHGTRFGDGGLARVQFNFDELHFLANNFEIDFIRAGCAVLGRRWRCEWTRGIDRTQVRHLTNRHPFRETIPPGIALRLARGLGDGLHGLQGADLFAVVTEIPLVHGVSCPDCGWRFFFAPWQEMVPRHPPVRISARVSSTRSRVQREARFF